MKEDDFDREMRLFINKEPLKPQRSHITIYIESSEKIVQEMTVLYKNNYEENCLKLIQIAPRRKKVQRNMRAYGSKKERLVIVPSSTVNESLKRICRNMTEEIKGIDDNDRKSLFECFDKLFAFKSKNTPNLSSSIEIVSTAYKKVTKAGDKNSIKKMLSLVYICFLYEEFYYPIIELRSDQIEPYEYYLIKYSVEHTQKFRKPFLSAIFLNFSVEWPLELEKTVPNHFHVDAPKGLIIKGYKISGEGDEEIKSQILEYNEENEFDREMIFLYFSPQNAKAIWDLQEKGSTPKIEVYMGVEKTSPFFIMTFLPYFFLLPSSIFGYLFRNQFNLSYCFSITGIVLILMTSIGIFSTGKDIYKELLKPHFLFYIIFLLIIWIIGLIN